MNASLGKSNRVVGIVVQSMPFQDRHQIISLFSAEWGLMRIIIKYAYAKKNSIAVEPLNLVEICLKESKSDLFQATNVSRLNTYSNLRSSYAILTSSLDLLASIVKSQVYHKPSPILFSLLIRYLDYMPHARSPERLRMSFKLKVLRHDGWLAIEDACSLCQQALIEFKVSMGQFFCHAHAPSPSLSLSSPDVEQIKNLALSLSFSQIDGDFPSSALEEKINSLFAEIIEN